MRIFSRAAEFARFRGISTFLQNFTEFCIGRWLRDKYCIFWPGLRSRRKLITVCRHDCAMKYVTDIRPLMWEILKILNLSEILPFYSVDRLYLSVAVTYRRQILQYLVGFKGRRKLTAICGKFAAVCRRIWQTGPRNLKRFAAENCGRYRYSYIGRDSQLSTPLLIFSLVVPAVEFKSHR